MRALLLLALGLVSLAHTARAQVLRLETVLQSVDQLYPPYLMALLERDIALGRLRQVRGAFDLNLVARGFTTPAGYYDGQSTEVLFDQALPFWGGNVFAGYRVSSGSLAAYDKDRTQEDGELRAGIRLNLLRDGPIDRVRADLWKAEIDRRIVDPFLQRQRLDLRRAVTRAYYNWVAAGMRYRWSEALFKTAKQREGAIREQAANGLLPTIANVDNERLVVSRELSVVQSRRRMEAAAFELSLYYRDAQGEPQVVTSANLPTNFPKAAAPDASRVGPAIQEAFVRRPELRRISLVQQKLGIDQRLARNNLLPKLGVVGIIRQSPDTDRYSDIEQTEAQVGMEFSVPLQRNEAKGRIQALTAEAERLQLDAEFARNRIVNEIRDAHSALQAAYEQINQTARNVELAERLADAESTKLREGASDLLALQIREQAAFEARLLEVDAVADYFRAQADFEAAAATFLNGISEPGTGRNGPGKTITKPKAKRR